MQVSTFNIYMYECAVPVLSPRDMLYMHRIQGCSFNPTTSQPIYFTLHQAHKIVDTHQHLLDGSHSRRRLLQPDRIKWRKFTSVSVGTSIKSILLTLTVSIAPYAPDMEVHGTILYKLRRIQPKKPKFCHRNNKITLMVWKQEFTQIKGSHKKQSFEPIYSSIGFPCVPN